MNVTVTDEQGVVTNETINAPTEAIDSSDISSPNHERWKPAPATDDLSSFHSDELYLLCDIGDDQPTQTMLSMSQYHDYCLLGELKEKCVCNDNIVFTFADRVQMITQFATPDQVIQTFEVKKSDNGEVFGENVYHAIIFFALAVSLLAILCICVICVCYRAKQLNSDEYDDP